MSDLQYIRTRRELIFQDCRGRHTILDNGVPGFVLSVDRIEKLIETSVKQQAECLRMLEEASTSGRTLVLLQGRPCILARSDFILCDAPVIYPIPNSVF